MVFRGDLNDDRISAMQINWFNLDCNLCYICRTNILCCIALLGLLFLLGYLLFGLLCQIAFEVFRSCGSDHGLCPLDSHKPLKRLDRNFYAWLSAGLSVYFYSAVSSAALPPTITGFSISVIEFISSTVISYV